MAEAKLRALGSKDNGTHTEISLLYFLQLLPTVKPPTASLGIPRKRISHRHSRSTPTVLPIPALSFSSTSSSRTSATESTLATPVNSVFNGNIPQIHMSDIADNSDDEEDNLDTPTPTPSPKARARSPARIRSATTVLAGQSPSILRQLSLSRSEFFSRSLTPPPRAKPSLAMSPEIHPRVDSVSAGRVTAPKPRRASQLTSPMSLTSFSLPASPLHQTTMLPSSIQQRPLSRSEHLLRSALLKDEFAQGSSTSTLNAPVKHPSKTHRRRHSHATVSADSPLDHSSYPLPAGIAVVTSPLSPSGRNTPTPRPRPVSPVHTKSAPVTHTMQTRLNPRSQSYAHALNEASSTTSTRLPLTPHEQVLRARLERVLSAGSVALPDSYQYGSATRSTGSSSSADDDSLWHVSGHDLSGEDYGYSADLRQLRLKRAERKKHRASAPANGSGFLGWLWRSTESDEEETPNPLFAPLATGYRQTLQFQDVPDERRNPSIPNSPRTPRMNTSSNSNALNAPSLPYHTTSPQLSPSPSRLRSHTQPLPSSPNRSPYGQGYTYSPKPKHAFSLGSMPSVARDISNVATSSGNGGLTGINGKGRMLTPPPTPPRDESVLFAEGLGQTDSPVNLSHDEHEPGSSEENTNLEASLIGRGNSFTGKSGRGQRSLGLGRPSAKSSEDSVSSTASSLAEAIPSVSVGVDSSNATDSNDSALSPLLSPTSALSTTSSFNARTASLQCREIDGYISFASIEGLGEPPVSALPTDSGDRGSMDGDEQESQKKGLFGRLFRR
ncbi:uncharacterized protein C8R40DRAFT_1176469 [Lentinula edodes]|uniref:uncharacterized protein n=1 Tax=Lentinula edodes TaxID=5353 RepID=UPI001E8DD150|nr:uncharacterized protein C8R40DRAFT_1176469 [Lentinula edodes]KAH7869762.1 hypothetical protein C8R40DRAFT_1176469 [Lentinula edodes]